MKRKVLIAVAVVLVILASVTIATAANRGELGKLRAATAKYQKLESAQADGYGLVPGLDHCFDNPGVGAMGFHYINTSLLDTHLDANRPEAMVYNKNNDGQMKLGAVEYIVPADAWAESGNSGLPEVMGRHLHLNEALGVYVLHAWVWQNNPNGVFEDWNPRVTCQ